MKILGKESSYNNPENPFFLTVDTFMHIIVFYIYLYIYIIERSFGKFRIIYFDLLDTYFSKN